MKVAMPKAKLAAVLCSVLALALLLGATAVWAYPPLPHAFYGTVTIGGAPAPIGTLISAQVGGVDCGNYTTSVVGQYGHPAELDYLVVQGDIETGATIDFYIDGIKADQTYLFEVGGGPTDLDLTSPTPTPSPPAAETPTPAPSSPLAETPTPVPSPPAAETPTPAPSPPPAETLTPTPSPLPAGIPNPAPTPGDGLSVGTWAGIGAAIAVVLGLGFWFILRRRQI